MAVLNSVGERRRSVSVMPCAFCGAGCASVVEGVEGRKRPVPRSLPAREPVPLERASLFIASICLSPHGTTEQKQSSASAWPSLIIACLASKGASLDSAIDDTYI